MDYNKIRKSKRKKRINPVIIAAAAAGVLILAVIILALLAPKIMKTDSDSTIEFTPEPTEIILEHNVDVPPPEDAASSEIVPVDELDLQTEAPIQEPALGRRGTSEPIPENVRAQMAGVSMPAGATVSYDDLAYLTIPHYDFNYNVTTGHLIVNAALAEEVLDIFAELYDISYPIERMEIVDVYGGSDYESIEHNNTSCFNYRPSTDGSGRLSNHALGRAIDINPQINPYVNGNGTGSHPNAEEYWSRDISTWSSEIAKAAYIGPDAQIYNIFVNEHGWQWGGSWSSYRDYQHFEK